MRIVIRLLKWLGRIVAFAVAAAVVLLVLGVTFVGLTPVGAQFAATRLSSLISNPDQVITINAPSGLLSGHLRMGSVTVADTQGIYAEVHNLSLDWSPLELVKMSFDAQNLTAESVSVLRAPVRTIPAANTGSKGFSLPVAVKIDTIDLADILVGKALAGQDFNLVAKGSVNANADSMGLKIAINRKDQPEARAEADLLFAPADNRLTLKADIAEPQGGMLSGLLLLPGQPAINLAIDGQGPLSDWSGDLSAALDGKPVLSVKANHQLATAGTHHIVVKGGGQVDGLLPPAFRPLFSGETGIDIAASFDANGKVNIDTGNITTGSLLLSASGTIDRSGQNNLTANLIGTSGPVDFRWPLGESEMRALVSGVDLTVSGAAANVSLKAVAALESLDLPQAHLGKIQLKAESDALDLQTRSGPVNVNLTVDSSRFTDASIDRAIKAPLAVHLPLTIAPDVIAIDGGTIESASIGGSASGRYDLAGKNAEGSFKIFAVPAVLPDGIAAKFDGTIAAEGNVAAIVGGRIDLTGLSLKSGTINAEGDVALESNNVTAAIKGSLPDIGKLLADASGSASFALAANGALSAPDIKATVDAQSATLSGRQLSALSLSVDGSADLKAPQATVRASGSLDGQPIDIAADLVSKDGITSLPTLTAKVGPNTVSGTLALSPAFAPDGKLDFNFPDLSLIAALAGQKAEGDLKGAIALASPSGVTGITIHASGSGIRRDAISISKPAVDLSISDLKALVAQGTVKIAEIASGSNRISNIVLGVSQASGKTGFDLDALYDGQPLQTRGDVQSKGGTMQVSLQSFSATPKGIPVKLATPTAISVTGGNARIDKLTIQTGSGSITVNGSAGQELAIDAQLSNLPASLANSFMPSLQAAGIISGTVKVRGTATSPAVDYDLGWAGAMTSQIQSAGLSALAIKANGQFANNALRLDATVNNPQGLAIRGGGSVAIAGNNALDLNFQGTLPFQALAGLLASQGLTMEGQAAIDLRISGPSSSPAINGTVTTSGAKLVDVRRNLALNGLNASVAIDRDRAAITRLDATLSTGGTISGSGTIGIASGSGYPADIAIKLNKAAYVDGTLFNTTADGTLSLQGPLLSNLTLKGDIKLGKTSITVPEKLPASLSAIDVKHRNAPATVTAQTKLLKGGESNGSSSTINLDLTISAPSQIFVRGRGIDAELGGTLTVRGTASVPVVSGGFQMKRGRVIILNKRLDFTSGDISFGGALIPALNMIATSTSGSTTITTTIGGLANDPSITFSSSPALPQDEILAQLIFGQSMSKLSALQIAQLADAASQLAGGRSSSLFQSLRSNLGVDDLDISTDAKGQAQVSAGKYLNKRTYLELQQSGSSGSKAIINLDVGRGVKLRGEAGSDGAGGAGIYYEKEY